MVYATCTQQQDQLHCYWVEVSNQSRGCTAESRASPNCKQTVAGQQSSMSLLQIKCCFVCLRYCCPLVAHSPRLVSHLRYLHAHAREDGAVEAAPTLQHIHAPTLQHLHVSTGHCAAAQLLTAGSPAAVSLPRCTAAGRCSCMLRCGGGICVRG